MVKEIGGGNKKLRNKPFAQNKASPRHVFGVWLQVLQNLSGIKTQETPHTNTHTHTHMYIINIYSYANQY